MYAPRKDSVWQVLRLIRQTGCMPTTEMVRLTGLTHASIVNAVNELSADSVIEPAGKVSPSGLGRKCQSYVLAPLGMFSVGIAVRHHHIELILIDLPHRVIYEGSLPNLLMVKGMEERGIRDIRDAVCSLLPSNWKGRLLGVGISLCGFFDNQRQGLVKPHTMNSLESAVRLREELQEELSCPVDYVNDIDAALIAERWELQSKVHSSPMIYVNDLLGFSVLVDGQIILASLLGGRRWLGTMPVRRDAVVQEPRFDGCLAATAHLSALTDRMRGFAYGTRPPVAADEWKKDVEELFARYGQGDHSIRHMIQNAFGDLGFTLRSLCMVFGIKTIVLEGWSAPILEDGMQIIRHLLEEGVWSEPGGAVPVVRPNSLGNRQQVTGAAIAAIDRRLGLVATQGHKEETREAEKEALMIGL